MTKLLILGRSGRMGQALIEAATADSGSEVAKTHDHGENLINAFDGVDAAIDFTVHNFTESVLDAALETNTPLVIGTTGHTDEEKAKIIEASKKLPIVFAANYSIGVNTLFYLTQKAAQILGNDRFDIEVTEMHHKHKIDSPSGTARRLLEILNEETNTSYEDDVAHGRVGNIGPRPPKEIGMHTLRGGDVVGDHTVMFAADGERVELTHKASSRLTFASGAVRASIWLQGRAPGLYDMQDVLGLK
ncbi:dihydrodipicolinate reductase [Rubritalea squalenifaciens DSM 18772]|uniref:4-hydroxy-tetrahydrodipicolinate reductase n=1 Tax=Rubritalea squalenifaciens DSM 18772 TaxID=1123071 RepID=A0A1M6ED39_9BACT|nr:4-hydroxy-tetrahydrodipicolinate reductase [Rubritalea squalenifaciens]SHI83385.1 dihydrodipicolinate reductase [Rubritalea squalenifaciens DSM 18772]